MKAKGMAGLVLCGFAASCGGQTVALNERLFELPSMAPAGAGCTQYVLGGGSGSSTGGGGTGTGSLIVSEHSDENTVVVEISDGNRRLVRRIYDPSFFHAGTIDDLVVASSAGEQLLVRHWGRDTSPLCTSFDLDSP